MTRRKQLALCLCLCLCLTASGAAHAATALEQEATAMADRGAALIQAKGVEEITKRIQGGDPSFVLAPLSLVVRDLYTGLILANPRAPDQIGTVGTGGRHPAPRLYPRQVIELAQNQGKGWVEPGPRAPGAPLAAYLLRVGEVVLEARIYQN